MAAGRLVCWNIAVVRLNGDGNCVVGRIYPAQLGIAERYSNATIHSNNAANTSALHSCFPIRLVDRPTLAANYLRAQKADSHRVRSLFRDTLPTWVSASGFAARE